MWLTPAVLFMAMNLVVATIAVASSLMSLVAVPRGTRDDNEAMGEPRGLLLCASSFLAVDYLRSSFSFSRLSLAANHAQVVQPLSGDDVAPVEPKPSLQQ